jgi:transcriptional regulator with XRE-family HTH domain
MSNIITGRQLRAARILAGLTQRQLAQQLVKENERRLVSHFDSAAGWTAFLLPDEN